MSGEASVNNPRKALADAVKMIAKTSKYQDRWIGDVDVAVAIRHEYNLWDSSFDDFVTYTKVNAALQADAGIEASMSGPDNANVARIFRREYKPAAIAFPRKKDDGTYTIEHKRFSRKTMKWYFFGGAKKVPPAPPNGGKWFQSHGGVKTGIIVQNERRYCRLTVDNIATIKQHLQPPASSFTRKRKVSSSEEQDIATNCGGDCGRGNGSGKDDENGDNSGNGRGSSSSSSNGGGAAQVIRNKRYRSEEQDAVAKNAFDNANVAPRDSVWWDDREAKDLFGACPGETAKEAAHRRLDILTRVTNTVDGYKLLLDDRDELDRCTECDKKLLEKKAIAMAWAIVLALDEMPRITWAMVCRTTAQKLQKFRIANVGPTMIEEWNKQMRAENTLRNPRGPLPMNERKQKIPPLFEDYPDHWSAFVQYGEVNLKQLSSMVMHSFVVNTIRVSIKEGKAIDMSRKDDDYLADNVTEPPLSDEDIKRQYNITTWSEETVRRWMAAAGFKYSKRKKHFYTDKHEDENNKLYRFSFTERYLKRERYMHRWVQVSLSVSRQLQRDRYVTKNSGYKYTKIVHKYKPNVILTGHGVVPAWGSSAHSVTEMVEYHVDESDELLQYIHPDCKKYGGALSVRLKPNEAIQEYFGQDEVIWKQFEFPHGAWVDPKGRIAPVPKDSGHGLMLSPIKSRMLGFGYIPTNVEIDRINAYRREEGNRMYMEESGVASFLGSYEKPDLEYGSSPFMVEFEYGSGSSKSGYWSVERMAQQIMDSIDAITVLLPGVKPIFLVDHSCGHDRRKDDALWVGSMNVGYGGKQPRMRVSENLDQTCVCEFNPTVEVGGNQSMVFPEADVATAEDGPYWMHVSERARWMRDIRGRIKKRTTMKVPQMRTALEAQGLSTAGTARILKDRLKANGLPTVIYEIENNTTSEVDLTKDELAAQLRQNSLNDQGTVEQLRARCTAHVPSLPTRKTIPDIIEGWAGKPKGKRQVCRERGMIDLSREHLYSEKGHVNDSGDIDESTSYDCLLNRCSDFRNELTLLQYIAEECGAEVDRSPICHPEVAGEGVEYDFCKAKQYHRKLPVEERKGKDNFIQSVRKAVSSTEGAMLTAERTRRYSRRARQYILAYHKLDREENVEDVNFLAMIEKQVSKLRKQHRGPGDKKFVSEN